MKENVTTREKISNILYYPLRIAIVLMFVILFVPALNPARICGLINKNLSLFTSGISYSRLTADFGRAFRKEWVDVATTHLVYISSIIAIIGVLLAAASGCMSVGNNKFKKLGGILGIVGSIFQIGAMVGIYISYTQILATTKPKKVEPMFPTGIWFLIVIAAIVIIISVIQLILIPKVKKEDKFEMESKFQLFLLLMPFVVLAFVFCYLPLWGWRYAFFDYKAGDTLSMSNFVGFKWFGELFKNEATVRDVIRVIKNTLAMSGLGIATSWLPMAFAIFLCEIKNLKFRRFVQTFTTVPNFISWVLVYAIAFCIFSTDGFISSLMVNAGIWNQGVNMLMSGEHTWLKMLGWGLWKGVGWSAIIYIAAISGIDQQLYEAATVDGAGRFQKMWHVTMPGLIPTYCVLLLMSIANILSNGMDQYLVFENSTNTKAIMVLDLYVYKLGIGNGIIPMSTVIGMLKSIISVILLFGANGISKLIRGESIV